MKIVKTTVLSTRVDTVTRSAFVKKAKKEFGHDPSSVLRYLISLYLLDHITIPKGNQHVD